MIQSILAIGVVGAAVVYLVSYFRRPASRKNSDQPCAHCAARKGADSR